MWEEIRKRINLIAKRLDNTEEISEEIIKYMWHQRLPEESQIEIERKINNILEDYSEEKEILVSKIKARVKKVLDRVPIDWVWDSNHDQDDYYTRDVIVNE